MRGNMKNDGEVVILKRGNQEWPEFQGEIRKDLCKIRTEFKYLYGYEEVYKKKQLWIHNRLL